MARASSPSAPLCRPAKVRNYEPGPLAPSSMPGSSFPQFSSSPQLSSSPRRPINAAPILTSANAWGPSTGQATAAAGVESQVAFTQAGHTAVVAAWC